EGPHHLAAPVAQLPLGDLACHNRTVARVRQFGDDEGAYHFPDSHRQTVLSLSSLDEKPACPWAGQDSNLRPTDYELP
ncbi:MAG: hypothetical protein M3481_02220, partial [Actinomycetota bacterium]|nr:hypothetical protein [Actinomycetota bacterium]